MKYTINNNVYIFNEWCFALNKNNKSRKTTVNTEILVRDTCPRN
jgi:hypothetical protein